MLVRLFTMLGCSKSVMISKKIAPAENGEGHMLMAERERFELSRAVLVLLQV
jgi:hypothetical protein